MIKVKKSADGLSAAAVLLLFALYALLAVGVLTGGMLTYRGTRANAAATYARRTSLSYVVNQVRQADTDGAVSVQRFHGAEALVLRSEYSGVRYNTYIYAYDGQLRELLVEEGIDLPLESGVAILQLENMRVSNADGLLTMTLVFADGDTELSLDLRSEEGGL